MYFIERILFGVSKAITEHIFWGEGYENVNKVYSINIFYFDIGIGNDYLYHGTTNFVGVHTDDELQVSLRDRKAILPTHSSTIFPEYFLIRVNEFNKVAVTPLEKWIEYLKTDTIVENTHTPGLEEARQKLLYYKMNKKEKVAYEQNLDALSVQKDAISTAYIDGESAGKIEGK